MPIENVTNVSLIGMSFAAIMGILLLFLPRRLAIIPVMVTACYMTMGQVINIASLNFTLMRVVILVGWLRLLIRGELTAVQLNGIDRSLILWALTSAIIYNIAIQTREAFINQLGFLYNTFGMYFLFRCLIRDASEVVLVVKALAVIIIPLAAAMVIETLTERNPFAVLGGVQEFSQIREGKLRAQGAFSHPILAGTFGATLVPLFVGLWRIDRGFRFFTAIGILAATTITVTSASSGPLMTYLCGLVGIAAWTLRNHMRAVRWSILCSIVSLHLVMKAPVWYVFARLSELTGGTGWHRSELIDQAIRHLNEWWLVGTRRTDHWMPYALDINPDMADITNEYLRVGVDSGLLAMFLFIVLIIRGFRGVGVTLHIAERLRQPSLEPMFIWALGGTLFAHVITFFSVSYFDQIILFWFLLIAMISTVRGIFDQVSKTCSDSYILRPHSDYNYLRLKKVRTGGVQVHTD